MKTYEERLQDFSVELSKLIKLHNIEPIATIIRHPSGENSVIIMLDLENDEMLAKYGRKKIKPQSDGSSSPPLAN